MSSARSGDAADLSDLCLVFLHANGFPGGVYRQFLAQLSTQVRTEALPLFDGDVSASPARRWQAMTALVVDHLQGTATRAATLALVGHSMGGYLSLMAARQLRSRVAGIVLIDSPLVIGWRSALVSMAQITGLSHRTGPAPIAARRRFEWSSAEAARAFFAEKSFVRRWAPGVLDDFIAHGLRPLDDGRVTLVVPREVERDIYAGLAHRQSLAAFRELRAHRMPVGFVAGSWSQEMKMAGRQQNHRLFGSHWRELPAGHLLPMEQPQRCADAVLELLGGAVTAAPRQVADDGPVSPA